MAQPTRMLVCFAMKEEAGAFQQLAKARPGVAVLVTGIGRKNSEKAVGDFFAKGLPDRVLTCGFAGGLAPELAIGTVLFTTKDPTLAARLTAAGAKSARFLCTDRIATTAAEKQNLQRTTAAEAVEMESEAIQALCEKHRLPCATVRAISDTAHEDMPLDFNQLSNPDRSLNYGKLAWAIAKSPGKIGGLMRLQKHSRLAAENLARVLGQVTA